MTYPFDFKWTYWFFRINMSFFNFSLRFRKKFWKFWKMNVPSRISYMFYYNFVSYTHEFSGRLNRRLRGYGTRKNGPRKNGRRKIGPRKNVLQKLFSVKRMLGNLNDFFICIDWFQYAHKKFFDIHLTIQHAPNCRILKESKNVCRQVLGFHRLITSEHSTHAHHDAQRSPHDFLFLSFPGTIFHRDIQFFRGPCFREFFSRGPFFRDSWL